MLEKTMAIFPLLYWGPADYFALILQNNAIQFEVQETFPKQTLRNRCQIVGPNGKLHITVPLIGRSKGFKTSEIQIDNSQNWRNQHWQSIQSAYGKAPYYEYYATEVEKLYQKEYLKLTELCRTSVELAFKWLKEEQKIVFTSSYEKLSDVDFRNAYKPGKMKEYMPEPYIQTFHDRFSFIPNLSILDVVFNLGPEAKEYLTRFKIDD